MTDEAAKPTSEYDPELISLLKSLSGKEPLPDAGKEKKKAKLPEQTLVLGPQEQVINEKSDLVDVKELVQEEAKKSVSAPAPVPEPPPVVAPVLTPAPVEEPTLLTKVDDKPAAALVEEQSEEDQGFKRLVSRFNASVEIIIDNHAKDRDQIERGISLLDAMIRDAVTNNKKISPAYVEAWAKLISAKTEVNANATGVLDSIAKLLSAGKKNDLILNQTQVSGTLDLSKLLEQPSNE